ncbi:MAG TPA: nuclear transport factor 2 family protein [Aridibacter sp.]|nr:nuclear transport factor 2 family protein [Aridibacter sp.]
MTNGDIVRGLYEAFAKGDIPMILGTFDESIEWTEAAGFMYGGTYRGPNGVLENVFMKLGTEWEGFSAVPGKIVDDGDEVVATGTYSGKYLATGRSMEAPFAHEWTLRNGKVVRFRQHTDTKLIAESLGL